MVDTQPESMRRVLYANTILLYFFIFVLASKSGLLLALAAISLLVFLGRSIFLIYVNERFTAFAIQFYAGIILTFTVMSIGGFYTVSKNDFHQNTISAALWGALPLLLVLIAFLIIIKARFKPETLPFQTRDGKVYVEKSNYSATTQSGLIAGVATLISGILLKTLGSAGTGLLISFFLTTLTLYLLFHYRRPIQGLVRLLENEKVDGHYTFANIEEIREVRSRWWLSRLFKWLARQFKKPSM